MVCTKNITLAFIAATASYVVASPIAANSNQLEQLNEFSKELLELATEEEKPVDLEARQFKLFDTMADELFEAQQNINTLIQQLVVGGGNPGQTVLSSVISGFNSQINSAASSVDQVLAPNNYQAVSLNSLMLGPYFNAVINGGQLLLNTLSSSSASPLSNLLSQLSGAVESTGNQAGKANYGPQSQQLMNISRRLRML